MENEKKTLAIKTLYSYIGSIVTALFGFFISILISRYLSINEYGIYGILMSFSVYFILITYLGIPNIFQRFIPELKAKRDFHNLRRVEIYGYLSRIIIFFVLLLLCFVLIDKFTQWLNIPDLRIYLFPFFLVIFFLMLNQTSESALSAFLLQEYQNISRVTYGALRFGIIILVVYFKKGLIGLIYGLFLSEVILFVLFLFRFIKESRSKGEISQDPDLWKRIRSFGLYTYSSQLGYLVTDASLDIYLISFFLGLKSAGLYSFAYLQATGIYLLVPISILTTIMTPFFTQKMVGGKTSEYLSRSFDLLNKYSLFFIIPISLVGISLAKPIISLVFDLKFLPSLWVFVTWMITAIFIQLNHILKIYLYVLEKVKIIFITQVLIIYNLVMDIVLIPRIGIIGAAIATGSSIIISFFIKYLYLNRSLKSKFQAIFILKLSLISIAIAALSLYLSRFLTNLYLLIPYIILAAIIYIGLVIVFRVFRKEEIDFIKSIFTKAS
jgi:O-antigen/teichoic acid export membrane protein